MGGGGGLTVWQFFNTCLAGVKSMTSHRNCRINLFFMWQRQVDSVIAV